MASNQYIPAGCTSLVKKGSAPLQVQTEYAMRPYPRVTTTILNAGQVVFKVVKKLEQPVMSVDEQSRMETFMKNQHAEIIRIVREQPEGSSFGLKSKLAAHTNAPPVVDRLRSIPGIQHVYVLNPNGDFSGRHSGQHFRKAFSRIARNLHEIMDVFRPLDGIQPQREQGIYEVERDRLYFASAGKECYFISVRRSDRATDFEKAIKDALFTQL